jgi:DNA helicase-2/ATP-dependent DNA helicase PcrA
MINGETRYAVTSRFIKEIPFGLFDMKIPSTKMRSSDEPDPSTYQKAKEVFHSKPFPLKKPVAVKQTITPQNPYAKTMIQRGAEMGMKEGLSYTVGDRVSHIKFGQGEVKHIVNGGRDYEVTVDFEQAGVKKMFASFAKLKKLE